MGCAESIFLALAIISLANVYGPFLSFAFAGFSQNMPQKTNGVSNGSIKNCPDESRKKVFRGSVSCQVSSDDFGKTVYPEETGNRGKCRCACKTCIVSSILTPASNYSLRILGLHHHCTVCG